MPEQQIKLPLDHEPSLNHWAILMADDHIENDLWSNWDAAYESAWDYLEELQDA